MLLLRRDSYGIAAQRFREWSRLSADTIEEHESDHGWELMMIVRTASVDELPQIEAMYAAIVNAMQNTPLDVWWQMGSHPSHEMLLDAASDGNLLVAVDDGHDDADDADDTAARTANPVLGACILNGVQGVDYGIIDWDVQCDDAKVNVLHLLGVAPAARGRGVGRAIIGKASAMATERGMKTLRLDTFDNNAPAIALYRSCGFTDHGVYEIHVVAG